MMWARIRFIMNDRGEYDDRQVLIPTDDFLAAAAAAQSLCGGYAIGSGYGAVVLAITSTAANGTESIDVRDRAAVQGMHNRLKSLERRV